MNYHNPELQQALCNDYVMGLMGRTAQKRFRKLLLQFPELREKLQATQARWNLLPLSLKGIPPSKNVWDSVERRLFRDEVGSQLQTTSDQVIPIQTFKANSWTKAWAIAASLAVVVLLVPILQREGVSNAPYQVVALVQNEAKQGWIIEQSEDHALRVRSLQTMAIEPQQDFELWFIADATSAPKSLGVLPQRGEAVVVLTKQMQNRLQSNALFAVTIESQGGSPTGQPTSTPIFTGKVIQGG